MNKVFYSDHSLKCDQCGGLISERYVGAGCRNYHRDCYEKHIAPRCFICKGVINDKYKIKDNKNYHTHCYEKYVALKCSLCDKFISGKYTKDYWGNCYHPYHKNEHPKCEYCGRLICKTLTGGGRKYSDGRCICKLCSSTAIEDKHVSRISKETLSLLGKFNIILNTSDFDLILIGNNKLSQLPGRKYNPKIHGTMRYEEETRNGTLTKQTLTVYVLFSLPYTSFVSVLTHELIHVYSRLFFKELSRQAEKGMAVLFSYLILKEINNDEANYLIMCLEENNGPVYGNSFRNEKRKYDKLGLENYIKKCVSDCGRLFTRSS